MYVAFFCGFFASHFFGVHVVSPCWHRICALFFLPLLCSTAVTTALVIFVSPEIPSPPATTASAVPQTSPPRPGTVRAPPGPTPPWPRGGPPAAGPAAGGRGEAAEGGAEGEGPAGAAGGGAGPGGGAARQVPRPGDGVRRVQWRTAGADLCGEPGTGRDPCGKSTLFLPANLKIF